MFNRFPVSRRPVFAGQFSAVVAFLVELQQASYCGLQRFRVRRQPRFHHHGNIRPAVRVPLYKVVRRRAVHSTPVLEGLGFCFGHVFSPLEAGVEPGSPHGLADDAGEPVTWALDLYAHVLRPTMASHITANTRRSLDRRIPNLESLGNHLSARHSNLSGASRKD
jgi:hypothetical protein